MEQFFDSNYVRQLIDGTLNGSSKVTILDKLTYAGTLTNLVELPNNSYRLEKADICDLSLVSKLFYEHDVIVNFAAESYVDRSIVSPKAFVESNIRGT